MLPFYTSWTDCYTVPASGAVTLTGTDVVTTAVVDILGTNNPNVGLKSTTRGTNNLSISVAGSNQISVYVTTAIGAGPGYTN